MANACYVRSTDYASQLLEGLLPARTPGALGVNDQADPNKFACLAHTAGPIGARDGASGYLDQLLESTQLSTQFVFDSTRSNHSEIETDPHVLTLAAVAYGEASVLDILEEMTAIACVCLRQQKSRGIDLDALFSRKENFAFAAVDGNPRTAAFRKATPAQRAGHAGMAMAIQAAQLAIAGGTDPSNGGYFWDGRDIKTKYDKHPKVLCGLRFTDKTHNVLGIVESDVSEDCDWVKAFCSDKPNATAQYDETEREVTCYTVHGSRRTERGRFSQVWESTAGYGSTIFWRHTDEFCKATGNKVFK